MIPYDVAYFRPETLDEAGQAFEEAEAQGLEPEFVGGGTEIVTMARDRRIRPGALVDLKGIAECSGIETQDGEVRFGSCLTLNEAAADDCFPLLAAAAGAVADRTVRNSITLGGNIAGRLPYREAVLPFLIAEATAEIAGTGGRRAVPLARLFDRRLRLRRGELLAGLRVSAAAAGLPHFHARRTAAARVDYPLLSACFVRSGGALRIAVSGVCDFPVRLPDQDLPRSRSGQRARAPRAEDLLAASGLKARADHRGSAGYRVALLQLALDEAVERLGEVA
jgi:CO/xanthine dehydrogenase FAD-binding subunit